MRSFFSVLTIFLNFLGAFNYALSASAQDNLGLSFLGACHPNWPCDQGIAAYQGKPDLKLSFLYDQTFAADCPCIRKMYQDLRPKLTRIHLTNGPGLRNNRLQKEEVFYGYNILSAEAAILRNDPVLKQKFEDVAKRAADDYKVSNGINRLYVSTCLECNFSPIARKQLIEWARPFFPTAEFVDNPLLSACLPGLVCEKHGPDPDLKPPCIVDLDGKDAESVDVAAFKNKYSSCIASYLWGYQFNLIDSRQKSFTAPRLRTAVPDSAYMEKYKDLLR